MEENKLKNNDTNKQAMEETEKMYIDTHDVYQLLIAECRYGYKRNNHLMPSGAYDHVKRYLPELIKVDQDLGLHTAHQLCEECISEQLNMNFYDGLDDEYNNREEALQFIDWLLEVIEEQRKDPEYAKYMPYNYNALLSNKRRAENHLYRVFELENFEEEAIVLRELTKKPVSKEEADKVLFIDELGSTSVTMNRIKIRTKEYPTRIIGEIIRIVEPETHKGKKYSIQLAEEVGVNE